MNNKKQFIPPQIFLQEEIKNLKILMLACAAFIICAIGGFLLGKKIGVDYMEDWQFIILLGVIALFALVIGFNILFFKKISWLKYLFFPVMVITIGLGILWMQSYWISLGFLLLVALAGFFNDWRLPLSTGILSMIAFFVLAIFLKPFSIPAAFIWLAFFIPLLFAVTFVTKRNYDFLGSLFKANQEISDAKTTLEIKVQARTKELKEIASGLEEKVSSRTKELQDKINELEKFQKIVIGRELKMIELKKQIKELKQEALNGK